MKICWCISSIRLDSCNSDSFPYIFNLATLPDPELFIPSWLFMQSKLQSSFIYLLPHSCSSLFLLLIHAQHFFIFFFAIEIWPSLKISFLKAETFNFSNFDGWQYLENSTKTFSTDSLSHLLGCIFFKCLLPISQLFICPPVQISAGCSLSYSTYLLLPYFLSFSGVAKQAFSSLFLHQRTTFQITCCSEWQGLTYQLLTDLFHKNNSYPRRFILIAV